jgi:hypothetical protein
MPTTLPVRTAAGPGPFDDLTGFVRKLMQIYVVIAMAMSITTAIEYHLGAFRGLTLAESILKATGTALSPAREINTNHLVAVGNNLD